MSKTERQEKRLNTWIEKMESIKNIQIDRGNILDSEDEGESEYFVYLKCIDKATGECQSTQCFIPKSLFLSLEKKPEQIIQRKLIIGKKG